MNTTVDTNKGELVIVYTDRKGDFMDKVKLLKLDLMDGAYDVEILDSLRGDFCLLLEEILIRNDFVILIADFDSRFFLMPDKSIFLIDRQEHHGSAKEYGDDGCAFIDLNKHGLEVVEDMKEVILS